MPRHFWVWPSLFFFFRQEMKLMRNRKSLRYDVVLCLHCSSLEIFQDVQKTKGYAGVVAGKQRETGFWKQGRARARPQEVSLFLIQKSEPKSFISVARYIAHTHVLFFSPHPNNSFPTEFPNTK